MNSNLLEVSGLHVSAGEKEILHGVDLTVGKDETHVLMGPNGTGKSTLGYAITGNPEYTVTAGKIVFDGENITRLPVNERAKKGIFLSFQNPLEVPGVTLSAFIRSALEQKTGTACFSLKISTFSSNAFISIFLSASDTLSIFSIVASISLL